MLKSEDLRQFYGGGVYHRWSILFRNHLLTEGTKYVADQAGAYWLFDAIASYHSKIMKHKDQRLQDFQIWILKVKGSECVLTCWADTGSGEKAKIKQKIPYTDFPLDEIKFYVGPTEIEGKKHWVVMLPSEY